VRGPEKADSCDDVLGASFETRAEVHVGKGAAFWSRSRRSLMHGQPRKAVEEMCLSASWDPSGRGTYGLSEYYFKEGDFDQALAWAKRVPKGSKRWGDARTMIGDVHSQLGRNDEALKAYLDHWNVDANASEERRKLAGRFANSAAMAVHKRDFWTAERFYRRAIVLDPEQAFAAAGLARVFAHFGLHDATVHWAERALSLDEERATQAAVALAETWIRRKNASEANKALDRLRRIEPGHSLLGSLARRIAQLH
jgi:tetratricopeptide (TPR) repeat protein